GPGAGGSDLELRDAQTVHAFGCGRARSALCFGNLETRSRDGVVGAEDELLSNVVGQRDLASRELGRKRPHADDTRCIRTHGDPSVFEGTGILPRHVWSFGVFDGFGPYTRPREIRFPGGV